MIHHFGIGDIAGDIVVGGFGGVGKFCGDVGAEIKRKVIDCVNCLLEFVSEIMMAALLFVFYDISVEAVRWW